MRYLWKRADPFNYSGHPTLNVWIPIEIANETNTFATKDEAYAAYGRYCASIVGKPSGEFTVADQMRWMEMKLVGVDRLPSPHYTEVASNV